MKYQYDKLISLSVCNPLSGLILKGIVYSLRDGDWCELGYAHSRASWILHLERIDDGDDDFNLPELKK